MTSFHIFVGGLPLTWHLTREPYTSLTPSPFETNPWSSRGVQVVLPLAMNTRRLHGFGPNTTLFHHMEDCFYCNGIQTGRMASVTSTALTISPVHNYPRRH